MAELTSKNSFLAVCAAIVAAGAVCYSGAPSGGVTNFDDVWQVESNPLVQSPPSLDRLSAIFFAPYHGEYQPVKLVSYLADNVVYGSLGLGSAFGMHLTNVILHLANAVLVALIALALVKDLSKSPVRETGALFVAGLSGLYFVVHPLHVESVSWLSSRKDVLSFFFMALSFIAFRSASLRWGAGRAVLSLLFFALALGAKATVVCLPFIAAAWWALASWRGGARAALTLFGLFALVLADVLLGLVILRGQGYVAGPSGGSYYVHLLTVLKTFPFYMRLLLFPAGLSAIYNVPLASGLLDPGVWWGALLLAAQICVVLFVRARLAKLIVLWYLFALVPVMQIIPTPVPSLAADRYAYVPSVAFAIAPAVILWHVRTALVSRGTVAIAAVLVAAGVLYAGALGAAAWSRNRVWRSSETLWSDVLAKNPASPMALLNLGQVCLERGDYARSKELFREAARVAPGFLNADLNLGIASERSGDLVAAKVYYQLAMSRPSALTPHVTLEVRAQAAYGLSWVFYRERRYVAARNLAEQALALFPELSGPATMARRADKAVGDFRVLADSLIAAGDAAAESSPARAARLYSKAADAFLEYPEPVVRLARLYAACGQWPEAYEQYVLAEERGAQGWQFDYDYGVAALKTDRCAVAAECLSRSLAAAPESGRHRVMVKLAIARAYLGEPAQALVILKEVLDADPADADARANFDAIKAFVDSALKGTANGPKPGSAPN